MPEQTEDEQQRAEAIKEILSTESRYYQRLQTTYDYFYKPASLVLGEDDLKVIFQCLPELLTLSKLLLSTLEVSKSPLGDIFAEAIPRFAPLRFYCIGHSSASEQLQECLKKNRKLCKLLDEASRRLECEGLELNSFLLEPVQRLTRYPLLLRQVLHYTPKSHPEHVSILKALKASEDFLRETNEAVRIAENRARLIEIQTKLDGFRNKRSFFGKRTYDTAMQYFDVTAETKTGQPRSLVHSGEAILLHSKKQVCIFLLSDLLMIAKSHADSLEVLDEPLDIQTLKFSLVDIDFFIENSSMSFRFEDADDAHVWLDELAKAQKSLKMQKRSLFKPTLQLFIGSMLVTVISMISVLPIVKSERKFMKLTLGYQEESTPVFVDSRSFQPYRATLPLANFESSLDIELFSDKPFSQARTIGRHRMDLGFLEFCNGTHRSVFEIPLLSPSQVKVFLVKLQIDYRTL